MLEYTTDPFQRKPEPERTEPPREPPKPEVRPEKPKRRRTRKPHTKVHAVVETPPHLPKKKVEGSRGNPRDITLPIDRVSVILEALTDRRKRAVGRGGIVATKLDDSHVQFSFQEKGELVKEVITVPKTFSFKAYKAKIGD